MDAFELLDHNCWRRAFQELSAFDHLSCRLVCTQFHNLLEEKRFQEKRKFHKVLPILLPYLEYNDIGRSWEKLRKARLVCNSWCRSVDKYVSEIYKPVSSSHIWHYFVSPMATRFWFLEQIEEFHERFGGYRSQPFPAKTVCIKNTNRIRQYPVYIEKVANFAERFGRDIFTMELDFNLRYYNTGYFFMCKLIKRILMHLPNLKTLCVTCANYNEYDGLRARDDPEKMATWIGKNQLPHLPLRVLIISGGNKIVEKYLVEKYAPLLTNFQRLFNHPHFGFAGQVHPIQVNPQLQFPNLRELTLDVMKYKETLEPLRFLQSPLKVLKLFLYFRRHGHVKYWSVDKALRNIKHLPLECLKIRAREYVNVAEADLDLEEYINESIQTLSIHLGYDCEKISFNFLKAFRNLEELKFKSGQAVSHPEDWPEEVELNEYLGEGEPYQSNVWEEVPSLKTLTVKRRLRMPNWRYMQRRSTYTREKYDIYAWEHENDS